MSKGNNVAIKEDAEDDVDEEENAEENRVDNSIQDDKKKISQPVMEILEVNLGVKRRRRNLKNKLSMDANHNVPDIGPDMWDLM